VRLNQAGVVAFRAETDCNLPAIKGRFVYNGTALYGSYGGEIGLVLEVPNSSCDGLNFTFQPVFGSVVPVTK
jgi:hypothetical protein